MARTEQLSIYLIKPGFDALEAVAEKASYNIVELPVDAPEGSVLIIRSTPPHPPNWLRFFPPRTHQAMSTMLAASAGAILFIHSRGRWFAICFGTGWHMLSKDSFVRSFGLKTALSVVKGDTLKSADISTYDNFAKHRRVSTSRGTTIDSFDIEGQLDLLRGVIGNCGIPAIGNQIGGKDSCVVWTKVRFECLHKLCGILLSLYEGKRVANRFPLINNIESVRDPSETQRLDQLLDDRIASDHDHDISVAPPDVVDWQNVHAFVIHHKDAPPPSVSIAFTDIRDMFLPDTPKCEELRHVHIGTETPAGDKGQQAWTLYDCMVTEIDDPANPNVKCILMAGEWYVVAASFVSQVAEELTHVTKHSVALPEARPDDTEGQYNEYFADSDPDNLKLLDKKNISYGGGSSRIEVCDVLSSKCQLYHIKDYNGSATLSHLFSQGTVSARLLLESEFRQEIIAKNLDLPEKVIQSDQLTPGEFEVVFAIICDAKRILPEGLPFFSKVRLLESTRELKRLGFGRVSIAKVTRQEKEQQ